MSGPIRPAHRPHEQLRTEAPKRREHTDKYVSAIVGGENQIDLNFANPILPKSADHFAVGIDELTVNLSALSMLEYEDGETMFRILRRGDDVEVNNLGTAFPEAFELPDGPVGNLDLWRKSCAFTIDRVYQNFGEIVEKFADISRNVNEFMRTMMQDGAHDDYLGAEIDWTQEVAAQTPEEKNEYLEIALDKNGNLKFKGSRPFWLNFWIYVPLPKYRVIINNDHDRFLYSYNPETNQRVDTPITLMDAIYPIVGSIVSAYEIMHNQPIAEFDATNQTIYELVVGSYVLSGNLFHNLDRRVTLEVGCSLPIKNSPMIDHGVEAPDFVLGRYMFHEPYSTQISLSNNDYTLNVNRLGTSQLQGPKDRVCYHHLQPQQKIQTLRVRLWARVRQYDAARKKWKMNTIMCPVNGIDYWHIKLHFREKGSSY